MVTVHVAGGPSLLRLLPGEAVVVELMAYDTDPGADRAPQVVIRYRFRQQSRRSL